MLTQMVRLVIKRRAAVVSFCNKHRTADESEGGVVYSEDNQQEQVLTKYAACLSERPGPLLGSAYDSDMLFRLNLKSPGYIKRPLREALIT